METRADTSNWTDIIAKIDAALIDFASVFYKSFAENQKEVQPRELIKRALFLFIWQKLGKAHEFKSIEELDLHYQQFAQNYFIYFGEFSRLDTVKKIISENGLSDPVSSYKHEMLKKIIRLYHAMMRTRYILSELQQKYSVDKCKDMGEFWQRELEENARILAGIDVDTFQKQSVNAIKSFNQYLMRLMHEKGYGQINLPGFLVPDEREKMKDSPFVALYSKLENLPKVQELQDLLDGKLFDSATMRAQKLSQYIEAIRTIRLLLFGMGNEVVIASQASLLELKERYQALQESNEKIMARKPFDALMVQLNELSLALNGNVTIADGKPVLALTARDVIADAGKQSQLEKIMVGLSVNGWNLAAQTVSKEVIDIVQSAETIKLSCDQHIGKYRALLELTQFQEELFKNAYNLIMDWGVVNQQLQTILAECERMLATVEANVVAQAESASQYVGSFLRHHWPKIVIGAAVVAVPAAAVSIPLLSAVSAAIMIPAGLLAGSAGGAGVGVIVDAKNKRSSSASSVQRPNVQIAGVNSHYIIHKLFSAPGAEQPPLLLVGQSQPAVTPSSTPMTALESAVPVNDEITSDEDMQHPEPSISRMLFNAAAQFPGQVVGQLVQVPGQLVQLPGQLVQKTGLFAQPTQTAPAPKTDDSKIQNSNNKPN